MMTTEGVASSWLPDYLQTNLGFAVSSWFITPFGIAQTSIEHSIEHYFDRGISFFVGSIHHNSDLEWALGSMKITWLNPHLPDGLCWTTDVFTDFHHPTSWYWDHDVCYCMFMLDPFKLLRYHWCVLDFHGFSRILINHDPSYPLIFLGTPFLTPSLQFRAMSYRYGFTDSCDDSPIRVQFTKWIYFIMEVQYIPTNLWELLYWIP